MLRILTSLSLILLLTASTAGGFFSPVTAHAAASYLSGYSKRDKVVIDHTQVDTAHSDFVVTLDLSEMSSQFWNTVTSGGGDIRVTKSDGTTEVPREIVAIDTASDTGILMFKADTASNHGSNGLSTSTDSTYYVYYDGSSSEPSPSASNGSESVWPTGSGVKWAGVWHMTESSGSVLDSTSLGNDLERKGTVTQVTGKIGSAQHSDGGGNSFLFHDDFHDTWNGELSKGWLQGWLKITGSGADDGTATLIGQSSDDTSDGGGEDRWRVGSEDDNSNPFSFVYNTGGDNLGTVNHATREWKYYVGGWDSSGREWFVDGTSELTDNNTPWNNSGSDGFDLYVFKEPFHTKADNDTPDADIDELRVSKTRPSSEWISTDYNNQNDPTTSGFFISVTSQSQSTGPARVIRLLGNVRLLGGVRLR